MCCLRACHPGRGSAWLPQMMRAQRAKPDKLSGRRSGLYLSPISQKMWPQLGFATLMLIPACLGWAPVNPMISGMMQIHKSRGCQNPFYSHRASRTSMLPVMEASFGRWTESDVARKKTSDSPTTTLTKKGQVGSFLKAIKKPKGTICERNQCRTIQPWHAQLATDSPDMFRASYDSVTVPRYAQWLVPHRAKAKDCLLQSSIPWQEMHTRSGRRRTEAKGPIRREDARNGNDPGSIPGSSRRQGRSLSLKKKKIRIFSAAS